MVARTGLSPLIACSIDAGDRGLISSFVDMGKGNLEMGVDDQKVTFDLFDAAKQSLDQNVCSKMDKIKKEMA